MSGGGHLVVGSIKFVEGMRTEVLQRLAEMIEGLAAAVWNVAQHHPMSIG